MRTSHDRLTYRKHVLRGHTFLLGRITIAWLIVASGALSATESVDAELATLDTVRSLAWYDIRHLPLEGKGRTQTNAPFDRLPAKAEQIVRKKVWELSRPGMCHAAILGRQLNRPVLNLGFSGNGEMEPELADLLAELDPAVYILDCLPNMNASEVTERTEPFVKRLRKGRPGTPILLVEDRTYGNAFVVASRREVNVTNRKAYRAAYERLIADGVKNLHYLEGKNLLGSDGEATIDSSHPTDLGFMRQARAFRKRLTEILPEDPVSIHRAVIEQAREEVPRADTASVVEIGPGQLIMVYHRYRANEHGGSDFGLCSIWEQRSQDGGRTWGGARELVAAREGDINVQAPAICRLPDGELLLLANHAHGTLWTSL